MSDALKNDAAVEQVRRDNHKTRDKAPDSTAPETTSATPSRDIADAARRRGDQLQAARRARGGQR